MLFSILVTGSGGREVCGDVAFMVCKPPHRLARIATLFYIMDKNDGL